MGKVPHSITLPFRLEPNIPPKSVKEMLECDQGQEIHSTHYVTRRFSLSDHLGGHAVSNLVIYISLAL